MFQYPALSLEQSKQLPVLNGPAKLIPAKFSDSTHAIWFCPTVDGPMVLKVCAKQSFADSAFWLGMNHLFSADFPNALGVASTTYRYLAKHGTFMIPNLVAAEQNSFVLAHFLTGIDMDEEGVTDSEVVALANHLGTLHQQQFSAWGPISGPLNAANTWGASLKASLLKLRSLNHVVIPDALFNAVLSKADAIQCEYFVPIMPDLRWDQCRRLTNGDIALIDLDAIVVGPAGLELVLVSYLLNDQQYRVFKEAYTKHARWPEFEAHKECYQLILFLMNVLGETNINRWMQV